MRYIDLQTAYITQFTGENGIVTNWNVFNEDGEKIGELPAKLNEKEAMQCLKFARKFELDAWNKGIRFGKTNSSKVDSDDINHLKNRIEFLTIENVKLANALDNLTKNGE